MTARSSNADEVVALLGRIDEGVVDEILATGATLGEIANALAEVERERETNERRTPPSSQEAEVRSILERLFQYSPHER